jgi:hypothetical protein
MYTNTGCRNGPAATEKTATYQNNTRPLDATLPETAATRAQTKSPVPTFVYFSRGEYVISDRSASIFIACP